MNPPDNSPGRRDALSLQVKMEGMKGHFPRVMPGLPSEFDSKAVVASAMPRTVQSLVVRSTQVSPRKLPTDR